MSVENYFEKKLGNVRKIIVKNLQKMNSPRLQSTSQ